MILQRRSARSSRDRRGLSLLEVIACTVLVTFLMMPIAGVIRASGQAINRATADGTLESQSRRTLRWLNEKLDVPLDAPPSVARNGRSFRIVTQGQSIAVAVQRGELIWQNATTNSRIVLAENVRSFSVVPRNPNGVTLGFDISLGLLDTVSRTTHSATTTVALK